MYCSYTTHEHFVFKYLLLNSHLIALFFSNKIFLNSFLFGHRLRS
nr:MAG TPA: hypothetical protein [Caudoviricetes sp.]